MEREGEGKARDRIFETFQIRVPRKHRALKFRIMTYTFFPLPPKGNSRFSSTLAEQSGNWCSRDEQNSTLMIFIRRTRRELEFG